MQLSLHNSACGRRLTAALAGPVTYANRLFALDAVCRARKEDAIGLFLVDFTLAWHIVGAPDEKAAFFDALMRRHELAGARIAYLNCPEGNMAELMAAADALGFEAAMFRGRSSAIDWLDRVALVTPLRPAAIPIALG
jgi:hypothetical protein